MTNKNPLAICPHCEESISASVSICPYCAENVKYTVGTTPKEVPDTAKGAQGLATQKIIEKTPEIDPVKAKMKRLEALLADGIITHEEFTKKKQQIIDEYLNV